MGWEFAARWVEEPEQAWKWAWRRVADDSGAVLEQSALFLNLEDCIDDARRHGFDEGPCRAE